MAGLSRPSTSFGREKSKTWMPGTRPGMTVKQMLRPDTLALTALLALLTAIGPLSVDLYLPSLPEIGRALAAPPGAVQLTISAYLVGFGAGQIVCGPPAPPPRPKAGDARLPFDLLHRHPGLRRGAVDRGADRRALRAGLRGGRRHRAGARGGARSLRGRARRPRAP